VIDDELMTSYLNDREFIIRMLYKDSY